MITVTPEGLKNFQLCSLLYKLRHEDHVEEYVTNRDERQIRFEDTMKKIMSFFFYKKQADVEPSYSALLHRWEKLWFPKGTVAADLAILKNEIKWANETSYTTQAAAALLRFYEDFAERPKEEVFLLDEPFLVPIDKGIRLAGVFDLVLRTGPEDFKLIKWSGRYKRPPAGFWSFDFAALDYAFHFRNSRRHIESVEYGLYDLGSAKPGATYMDTSSQDIVSLKFWIKELAETEIFAPRRGLTSYCKSCPFWEDSRCKHFKYPTQLESINVE